MKPFDKTLKCGCRLILSTGILFHHPCLTLECMEQPKKRPRKAKYVNDFAVRQEEPGYVTDDEMFNLVRSN